MTVARGFGMALLALTGIGLIYMLARTQWVAPNSTGIVLNYNTQQYEALEPGIHCLLSPNRSYIGEVSKQVQVERLGAFSVKSLDNVDAVVQVDFTYKIEDPLVLYQEVLNPIPTFLETVKSAFSSAIQTLKFPRITSAEINKLTEEAGHEEHPDVISSASGNASLSSQSDRVVSPLASEAKEDVSNSAESDAEMIRTGSNFFHKLLMTCKKWGVKIQSFRIVTIEAKHAKVSEALELTAQADVKARADLIAAHSQAKTIKILAEANKEAQIVRADAVVAIAEKLGISKEAVYEMENQVAVARALGSNGGNVFSMNGPALFSSVTSRASSSSTADSSARNTF